MVQNILVSRRYLSTPGKAKRQDCAIRELEFDSVPQSQTCDQCLGFGRGLQTDHVVDHSATNPERYIGSVRRVAPRTTSRDNRLHAELRISDRGGNGERYVDLDVPASDNSLARRQRRGRGSRSLFCLADGCGAFRIASTRPCQSKENDDSDSGKQQHGCSDDGEDELLAVLRIGALGSLW